MNNKRSCKSDRSDSDAPDSADERAIPPYPREAYSWYVVGILMIVYVFPFMDRQIFALLVDPIKADLDIPGTQISYLGDFAFALFYPFFGIPNAGMADSKNRKVIISIGLATLSTSAYSLISDRFRSERMAIAISIYSAGVYIGTGLSNIFGGSVIGYAESLDNISLSVIVAVEL